MKDTQSAKSQIIESIQKSTNILVTVSNNPSVDELSAALGLTALLNKIDKHATAVVSGKIPPAIQFLKPREHFEPTTDSLRDFIVALDKEKADHARIKLVDDKVHILITPYRATITQKDLSFGQSDEYNVDLVLALNVSSKDNLDSALTSHGRILHDATVTTITLGEIKSSLGSVDWHENNASSLCEMLVSLAEALKDNESLLDEQISTAFLTGIVAATARFSNEHTTSRAMTMSAQLMASGANQQLIVTKLGEEEKRKIEQAATQKAKEKFKQNSERFNSEKKQKNAEKSFDKSAQEKQKDKQDGDGVAKILTAAGLMSGAVAATDTKTEPEIGDIEISHEKIEEPETEPRAELENIPKTEEELQAEEEARIAAQIEVVAEQQEEEASSVEPVVAGEEAFDIDAQERLAQDLAAQVAANPPNAVSLDELRQDLVERDEVLEQELSGESPESSVLPEAAPLPPLASMETQFIETVPILPSSIIPDAPHIPEESIGVPTFGGTLNATTEQAADDQRAQLESERNQVILDHDMQRTEPFTQEPLESQQPQYPAPPALQYEPQYQAPVPPLPPLQEEVNPFVDPNQPSPFANFAQSQEPELPQAFGGSLPEELEQPSFQSEQAARDDVQAAFASAPPPVPLAPMLQEEPLEQRPIDMLSQPVVGQPPMHYAPGLPAMPDFSSLPPMPEMPQFSAPGQDGAPLGGGAVSVDKLGDIFAAPVNPPPAQAPQPFDPAQFKIPTQQ